MTVYWYDRCETLEGWSSTTKLSISSDSPPEGDGWLRYYEAALTGHNYYKDINVDVPSDFWIRWYFRTDLQSYEGNGNFILFDIKVDDSAKTIGVRFWKNDDTHARLWVRADGVNVGAGTIENNKTYVFALHVYIENGEVKVKFYVDGNYRAQRTFSGTSISYVYKIHLQYECADAYHDFFLIDDESDGGLVGRLFVTGIADLDALEFESNHVNQEAVANFISENPSIQTDIWNVSLEQLEYVIECNDEELKKWLDNVGNLVNLYDSHYGLYDDLWLVSVDARFSPRNYLKCWRVRIKFYYER